MSDQTPPKDKNSTEPTHVTRDFNDQIIQNDWWLRLTKIFYRLIGKS